jgi:hypothetical protein
MNKLKINKVLTKVYRLVNNLYKFPYVENHGDKNSIETLNTICYEDGKPIFSLLTEYIFHDYNSNNIIYEPHDILAGIYCPYHNIGDIIDVLYSDGIYSRISTINITDPNKIYLPIDNEQFILYHYLVNNKIIINTKTEKPIFVIWIKLQSDVKEYLQNKTFAVELNQSKEYLLYKNGGLKFRNDISKKYDIYSYREDVYAQRSATIIQREYRKYKQRQQKEYYKKWQYNITKVNTEIKVLPNIGIEYFESMNEFYFLQ